MKQKRRAGRRKCFNLEVKKIDLNSLLIQRKCRILKFSNSVLLVKLDRGIRMVVQCRYHLKCFLFIILLMELYLQEAPHC